MTATTAIASKAEATAIAATVPWFSGVGAEVRSEKCVGMEAAFHVVCVSFVDRTGRTTCNSFEAVAEFVAAHGRTA